MSSRSLPDILDTLCSSAAKLHLALSPTLSNRWRHERLRMLEKAATAILREPTKIITDTKAHHTLRLEGQFEDCDESEEEAVLLVGQFRRMTISVRNLEKLPRTCRRVPYHGCAKPSSPTGRSRWCSSPVWDGLVAGPSSTSSTWWSNA